MEPLQAKLAGGGREGGRGCGAPGIFEQLVGGETMALTSGVEGGQVVLVEVISG